MSHTTKLNNVVWEDTTNRLSDGNLVPVAVTRGSNDGRYFVWFAREGRWLAASGVLGWDTLCKYIDYLRAELSATMADLEKAQVPALEATVSSMRVVMSQMRTSTVSKKAIQECSRLGASSAPPQVRAHNEAHDALNTLIDLLSEGEPPTKEKP